MSERTRPGYICADCEEDQEGFPEGRRKGDGRPLCLRCASWNVSRGEADFTARPCGLGRPFIDSLPPTWPRLRSIMVLASAVLGLSALATWIVIWMNYRGAH